MARIGTSDLDIFPLALGGNVFGWTADRDDSFAVMDAFVAGGGNFIDSADVYSAWVDGNHGGESETIIGEWMADRGNRRDVILATKGGSLDGLTGGSRDSLRKAIAGSLDRLKTDYIDLYYLHRDDQDTPLEETIGALSQFVDEGRVRYVALSNFTADRLTEALSVAERTGAHRPVALQPLYNLVERGNYEGELEQVVETAGLSAIPYSSLASGFLTGKYRDGASQGNSPRAGGASKYLDERGRRVLTALDTVAANRSVEVGSVALAWLAAQTTVVAPIASARSVDQVPGLLASASLSLTPDELQSITDASV